MKKRIPTIGELSNIDLRQLKIFKAVVENGGISAAESYLNISRPAISMAVTDLEERISLNLASRGRSGFELTDEGHEVYELILQLFTSIETFRTQINALHKQLRGELNIGITDNLITHERMNITHGLAKLSGDGDQVQINIRMQPPSDVERSVIDGRLHVGVIPKFRNTSSLDYIPLYQETSYLYCSDEHPAITDAITKQEITRFNAVTSIHPSSPKLKTMESELQGTATATDREGIAFLILTGKYIGFLPSHYAERWVSMGRMHPLLPDQFSLKTEYVAITRKDARPNRIVSTFLNWIQQDEPAA